MYKEYFFTDNASGWKCREVKLRNNNLELYNHIIKYCNKELKDISFIRKVWHFINDSPQIPLCPECGKECKFLRLKSGYQQYCSIKCSNKNVNKINQTKNILIDKYGVNNSFSIPEVKDKIITHRLEKYGVDNIFKLPETQEKIKQTNFKKYGHENIFKSKCFSNKFRSIKSKIETKVFNDISGDESQFYYSGKTFDIRKGNNIFEIDGDFFHPTTIEVLTLLQINSLINDKEKSDIIKDSRYTLYKVKVSDLEKQDVITVDILKNISYTPNYTINYGDKIITKDYFKKFIEEKGGEKLYNYIPLLLKFIRTFNPEFPYPENNEDINNILYKIKNYDFSTFHDTTTNTFNNNTSVCGNIYLKSIFKSFWASSFKNNLSPVEIWKDDEKMFKIIQYRIGLNNSEEIYDFSLRNLIRGISAIRGSVSFFKPIVAAGIYKHYLGDVTSPIVFDPCCGFGGRLLGFKSLYPNGTYIGCEPNYETYKELLLLSKNFINIKIYNCKLEDLKEDIEYDFAFTSIPYFDLEDYKNNIGYENFEHWESSFIKKLLSHKNMVINMNYDLCLKLRLEDKIDGYLTNSKTHFSRSTKKEVLLKF